MSPAARARVRHYVAAHDAMRDEHPTILDYMAATPSPDHAPARPAPPSLGVLFPLDEHGR